MKTDLSKITADLFEGFGRTLLLFAITLVVAIPLGMIIALGSDSKFKPWRWLSRTFVWIIRGTPLLLQIIVVSFIPIVVFRVSSKDIARALDIRVVQLSFVFVAIAFVVNYAAYFSEIYRGGLAATPKGQFEAAKVLGLTRTQTHFKIVLPQLFKRVLTPMSNEIITLVKDTALARIIGVMEILAFAEFYANKTQYWVIFYSGIFYLAFNGILTLIFRFIEKKLDYYKV